jgi:hypothetical protein
MLSTATARLDLSPGIIQPLDQLNIVVIELT